ncbi:MAG TPA: rhomboid family intramembrane serine protease, partial [Cyclobacteriaceae bacterium]|nr:rhomboid family intramembrane serine protease [Cyclobacteriaceae bacterium]
LTGLFTWYFGKPGYHFGMSGVAIGYSFFIIGSSLFTMDKKYLIIATITILTQFALLLKIFDTQLGISDDAHISGAFAGGLTAFFTQSPWKKRS